MKKKRNDESLQIEFVYCWNKEPHKFIAAIIFIVNSYIHFVLLPLLLPGFILKIKINLFNIYKLCLVCYVFSSSHTHLVSRWSDKLLCSHQFTICFVTKKNDFLLNETTKTTNKNNMSTTDAVIWELYLFMFCETSPYNNNAKLIRSLSFVRRQSTNNYSHFTFTDFFFWIHIESVLLHTI